MVWSWNSSSSQVKKYFVLRIHFKGELQWIFSEKQKVQEFSGIQNPKIFVNLYFPNDFLESQWASSNLLKLALKNASLRRIYRSSRNCGKFAGGRFFFAFKLPVSLIIFTFWPVLHEIARFYTFGYTNFSYTYISSHYTYETDEVFWRGSARLW